MDGYTDYVDAHREVWGAVADLVRQGREEAHAAAAQAEAQQQAQAADEAARRAAANDRLVEQLLLGTSLDLATAIPGLADQVRQFVAGLDRCDLNRGVHNVRVEVTGLAPFLVRYDRMGDAWRVLGFCLPELRREYDQYDRNLGERGLPEWRGWQNVERDCSFERFLHRAACLAYKYAAMQQDYEDARQHWDAEQEVETARRDARVSELAAQTFENQIAEVDQEKEIERLILWARADPAALNLIRTFMAIEQGRANAAERLTTAYESTEWAEARYASRIDELNRKGDELRRQVDDARAEARRHAGEAEDLEKKLKVAQRNGNGRS